MSVDINKFSMEFVTSFSGNQPMLDLFEVIIGQSWLDKLQSPRKNGKKVSFGNGKSRLAVGYGAFSSKYFLAFENPARVVETDLQGVIAMVAK